ncbi:AtpZ/AtpI family protein [Hymenobacter sp. CRA2]|uniref:AtpZ/AtpI family protein n=1 Tax=Hymenobacter sp. CRA2 TaxID=1955620 RepID=UPI00098FD2F2|nr:AtpZ/AtpI family protein [Hymenobacter sp. CRA2]OON70685.1 hypothetical protein B0919_01315 [Hymenobacter sp. CRA2]
MPEPTSPEDKRSSSQIGRYSGVGFQMLVTIGLCTWLGVWLDGRYGWRPWATIALSLFGVFVAMYQIIKAVSSDK